MSYKKIFRALICLLTMFQSCKKELELVKSVNDDLTLNVQNWLPLFSDYPVGEENFYELIYNHSDLPLPLDQSQKSIKISGNNHSDDLLMMIYKKFDGLIPNSNYQITFDIDLASNVATNQLGVGGSPDLAIGGGALNVEPGNKTENVGGKNYYRPNFNSRLLSYQTNDTFTLLGRIGVTDTTKAYTLINRNNLNSPLTAKTNNKGELWLLIGVDSGFEGITTLYFRSIRIKFYK